MGDQLFLERFIWFDGQVRKADRRFAWLAAA